MRRESLARVLRYRILSFHVCAGLGRAASSLLLGTTVVVAEQLTRAGGKFRLPSARILAARALPDSATGESKVQLIVLSVDGPTTLRCLLLIAIELGTIGIGGRQWCQLVIPDHE